ncbi:MAG: hypothetical protein ACRDSE_08195 [Pseudonocardiaceae bacterium]
MTKPLDEFEHVVSSAQPELRREQDNILLEPVRETLQMSLVCPTLVVSMMAALPTT